MQGTDIVKNNKRGLAVLEINNNLASCFSGGEEQENADPEPDQK